MAGDRFTLQEIRDGFERFYQENGRYPTALEVDAYPHLPSARLFQRRLGGLRAFRKQLGHEITDYGRGQNRSGIAIAITRRGRLSELEIEKLLVAQFGEAFVHVEKRFGTQGHRVDFYVYSPSGNFGVDVFWAASIHHVRTITIYFLCANRSIPQKDLDTFVANKKHALSPNTKLVSPTTFAKVIAPSEAYRTPVK
jgi:hypothetical protein